ncbi:hypothetical protein [Mesorhizobium tianshanense]|uniref:hypothetical protein n=1 Tax=Mesorhizobium tianshanense TaxID=39844 RepID=UPI0011A75A30
MKPIDVVFNFHWRDGDVRPILLSLMPVGDIGLAVWPSCRVRVVIDDCGAPTYDHVIANFDPFGRDEVTLSDEAALADDDLCVGPVKGKDVVENTFVADRMMTAPRGANALDTHLRAGPGLDADETTKERRNEGHQCTLERVAFDVIQDSH